MSNCGRRAATGAHKVMKLDLAKHLLHIEGVVVGALITGLDDTESTTRKKSTQQ